MLKRTTPFAILLATIIGLNAQSSALADEKPQPRTISVSGTGEIRVEPDEVIIRFGIQKTDKELRNGKKASDKAVEQVLKYLTSAGIKPDDVQTDELNVEPQYADNSWRRGEIASFWVSRGITVHLRDVSKFED